jgi:hypothetical protein
LPHFHPLISQNDIITLITTTSIAQIEARQYVDDLIDSFMIFDEGADVHLPSVAWTQQGIDFINLANHLSPPSIELAYGGEACPFI